MSKDLEKSKYANLEFILIQCSPSLYNNEAFSIGVLVYTKNPFNLCYEFFPEKISKYFLQYAIDMKWNIVKLEEKIGHISSKIKKAKNYDDFYRMLYSCCENPTYSSNSACKSDEDVNLFFCEGISFPTCSENLRSAVVQHFFEKVSSEIGVESKGYTFVSEENVEEDVQKPEENLGDCSFAVIEYYDRETAFLYPVGVLLLDLDYGTSDVLLDDENRNLPEGLEIPINMRKLAIEKEKIAVEFISSVEDFTKFTNFCSKYQISKFLPVSQIGVKGQYIIKKSENSEKTFDDTLKGCYDNIVTRFEENVRRKYDSDGKEQDKKISDLGAFSNVNFSDLISFLKK